VPLRVHLCHPAACRVADDCWRHAVPGGKQVNGCINVVQPLRESRGLLKSLLRCCAGWGWTALDLQLVLPARETVLRD
jgi:hypothetical protein